jgi:CheY-like chemotaxis protein/nitrogen-specific signal transduction histidine kinase
MDDTNNSLENENTSTAQKPRIKVNARTAAMAKITPLQLAKISHELRTFLNSITGIAQVLQLDNQLSPEEIRECINSIQQTSSDLLSLTNDILDFTTLGQGELQIPLSTINLQQTIEQTIREFVLRAKQKKLSLVVEYSHDAPQLVKGNAHRVRQILSHLLDNALKSTHEGTISINLSNTTDPTTNAHYAKISIKDTGTGISPEKLSAIFSHFPHHDENIDNHFIYQKSGAGIGLMIVAQLVESMHGSIDVNSEINKGSEFTFTLPIVVEPEIVRELADIKEKVAGLKVLIMSDDLKRCEFLKHQLTDWGMICTTTNLRDALFTLRSAEEKQDPWQIAIISTATIDQHTAYFARTLKANNLYNHLLLLFAPPTPIQTYENEQALASGFAAVLTPLQPTSLMKDLAEAWNTWSLKIPSTIPTVSFKKHAILLVEDNAVNQKVAKILLSELNCQVDLAENGQIAINLLYNNRYDLVFMDISLPDMSGIEVTNELRRRENNKRRVPVIALTADSTLSDNEKLLTMGIDDYLIKPYTLEQLDSMLKKWIKSKSIN